MINCEIELILTWSKKCVLANTTAGAAGNNNDPPVIVAPTELELQITDTKLHVLVVTLSNENDKKLLERLKSGFKRTVKWNKHISQITVQSNNNNLSYLVDSTFTKINRLLFCHLKELKKTMLKKVMEILFSTIMYQTLK